MTKVDCPRCGATSEGSYCPGCGAHLKPDPCPECGATPPPGARFCTGCGTPLEGARAPSWLPWAGAAVAIVALALIVSLVFMDDEGAPDSRVFLSGGQASGAPAAPFAGEGSGTPPPLTGTPREQADRLFNRVMEELSAGDTARAAQFFPMAIQAYQMAEPLDADGLYHLSLIQTISGNPAAGQATAQRVLEADPDHLLALAAAAEAAQAQGDTAAAQDYWSRFLEALPTEREALPEYRQHAGILPEYEAEARATLGR